jgi:hypothetical protein
MVSSDSLRGHSWSVHVFFVHYAHASCSMLLCKKYQYCSNDVYTLPFAELESLLLGFSQGYFARLSSVSVAANSPYLGYLVRTLEGHSNICRVLH